MQHRLTDHYRPLKTPTRTGPIRTMAAVGLLVFGTVLARLGLLFAGTGERWVGNRTVRSWTKMMDYFQGVQPGQRQPTAAWEQTFIRFGSSVLVSIISTLLVMWSLLLVGGGLAWLALNGYGLLLLVGAVTIGTIIGTRGAQWSKGRSGHENLN